MDDVQKTTISNALRMWLWPYYRSAIIGNMLLIRSEFNFIITWEKDQIDIHCHYSEYGDDHFGVDTQITTKLFNPNDPYCFPGIKDFIDTYDLGAFRPKRYSSVGCYPVLMEKEYAGG